MKKNKKGFTLAELLIVVAIIGVLVAISIPIFNAQLEKAREAADLANLRSAYAAGCAKILTEEQDNSSSSLSTVVGYVYEPGSGKFITAAEWNEAYVEFPSDYEPDCVGKGTKTVGSSNNAYGDITEINQITNDISKSKSNELSSSGIVYDPSQDVSGMPIVVYIDWKNGKVLACFWPR